jgi:hypothetical protein
MLLTDEEAGLSAAILSRGRQAARPCLLLVQGQDPGDCVAVWKAPFSHEGIPRNLVHWMSLDCTRAGIGIRGLLHVFSNGTSMTKCVLDDRGQDLRSVGGTPLRGQVGETFPHPDEHWEVIAPPGYDAWLNRLRGQDIPVAEQTSRVHAVLRAYTEFYSAHDPLQNKNDLYAVAGGWGFFVYADEWANYPQSRPVLFTLKDSEPWLSIRMTSQGQLVAQTIIT